MSSAAARGFGSVTALPKLLIERELAVAGERDLAAGIAVFRDVPLDQGDQPVDLAFAEAEQFEIGLRAGENLLQGECW